MIRSGMTEEPLSFRSTNGIQVRFQILDSNYDVDLNKTEV